MVRRGSKKVGLSPGSLVYTGEARDGPPRLGVFSYDEAGFQEWEDLPVDEALAIEDPTHVDWLNVNGLNDTALIDRIGEHFGLHPLTREDLVSTGQRPKIEFFDDYIYIVLRMLSINAEGSIRDEQVSLILGNGYVVSFQERDDGDVFDPVRERIRQSKGRIRKLGADYLTYALIDVVVDNYFLVLEAFAEELDVLEEQLLDSPTRETLAEINTYKREMIFLRKLVWPLRDVISACYREEADLFSATTLTYLRDVHDHTVQVIDTIETFRELLTGMLDVYLSSISNKTNEVMKVLTIIATIFIPLTFIVGVYGMNFAYMPELAWRWGYPAVWGIMILVTVGLLAYFKRKDWL